MGFLAKEVVWPLTSKSIWALGHGSIVWSRGPTSVPLGIPTRAHNNYESKLGVVQIPNKRTTDSSSHIDRQDIPGQYANVRLHCPMSARQCLRKLRCWAHLLQWEPFPKPCNFVERKEKEKESLRERNTEKERKVISLSLKI